MKFIITGQAGSGVAELASRLAKMGLKACPLYTTRPRLKSDEQIYAFLTEKDAAAIPEEDKLLLEVTETGGENFILKKDNLAEAEIIFIENPILLPELDAIVNKEPCQLIYVYGGSLLDRKIQATRDTEKPLVAEQVFNQRNGELLPVFLRLEKTMNICKDENVDALPMPKCIARGQGFEYDFNPANINGFAKSLCSRLAFHNRLIAIIEECGEMDVLYKKDGLFMIAYNGAPDTYVTADRFAEILSEDDEGMASIMREYIAMSHRFDDVDLLRGQVVPADDDAADTEESKDKNPSDDKENEAPDPNPDDVPMEE